MEELNQKVEEIYQIMTNLITSGIVIGGVMRITDFLLSKRKNNSQIGAAADMTELY